MLSLIISHLLRNSHRQSNTGNSFRVYG